MQLEDRCVLSSSILGGEILVNSRTDGDQELALHGDHAMDVATNGTAVVAWSNESKGIIARRIGLDGYPLGGEISVGPPAAGVRGNANVAVFGNDRFVVAWMGSGTNGSAIFARTYSMTTGKSLTGVFQVNLSTTGNQRDPAVEWISANQFVVTWTGPGSSASEPETVYARLMNSNGTGAPKEITVPDTKTGTKQDPVVNVLPNGGFQIAWGGNGPGDPNGIFSRQFTSAGVKVGRAEFRVNTTTVGSQMEPAIAGNADQIVIAWQSKGNPLDPAGTGIVARLFPLDGSKPGNEFLINQSTGGNQSDPTLALLADKGIVAAWRTTTLAGDGIYQREFNPDGTPRFGERKVNTTDAGSQAHPTIAAQAPDGYAVVWSGKIVGDSQGIGMQRYGDPLMPAITSDNKVVNGFNEVLYLKPNVAGDPNIPMKTFTLHNSSNLTIYPFLEDANASAAKDKVTGLYDPYDPLNQEYRGYIGYKDPTTGQFFLGLKPGDTYTFQVPLVFWDGGRMHVTTDAHYLITPMGDPNPSINPFKYYDVDPFSGNPQTIEGKIELTNKTPTNTLTLTGDQTAKLKKGLSVSADDGDLLPGTTVLDFKAENGNTTVTLSQAARAGGTVQQFTFYNPTARFMEDTSIDGSAGRIMWYHARAKGSGDAEGVGLDAPTQLTEFTIRDPILGDTNFKTNAEINSTEKVPLINYDVSYVDSMMLPVAMETTDVQPYPQQRYEGAIQLDNNAPTNQLLLNVPHLKHLLDFTGIQVTSDSGDLPAGTMVDHVEDLGDTQTRVFLTKTGNPNAGQKSIYTFTHPQPTAAFGWTGASQTFDQMQAVIKQLTRDNKPNQNINGLGLYFADENNPNGRGYPEWYNPDVTLSGVKLPSGQNLPGQSPLKADPGLPGPTSNFDSNRFIVTSDDLPIKISAGGSAGGQEGTGPNQIYLNFNSNITTAQREAFRQTLIAGKNSLVTKATDNQSKVYTLPKINSVDPLDQNNRFRVNYDGPTGLASGGYGFDFYNVFSDYASTRLAQIWYSWAKHYVDAVTTNFGNGYSKTLTGGVLGKLSDTQPSNELTFTGQGDLTKLLALGMVVKSNPDIFPQPTTDDPNTRVTILNMTYDKAKDITTVFLSKLPKGFGDTNTVYTFSPPVRLSDPDVTTFDMQFTKDANDAELFARSVYQLMEAMNTIKLVDHQGPAWLQLLTNCIGGNIGFIKDIGITGFDSKHPYKFDKPLGNIPDVIRDTIKSVLRGVWNYTDANFTEDSGKWYPDPSLKGGAAGTGQMVKEAGSQQFVDAKYNLLNIDPFVWFVHKELGLSGYGFSLDDDVADIGAPGATKLDIGVGGLTNLPQQAEWVWGAPYGPLTSQQAKIETYQSGDSNNGLKKLTMLDSVPLPPLGGLVPIGLLVHGGDPAVGPGALVYGPGIPLGTRVFLPIPFSNEVILTTRVPQDTTGLVGPFNFRGRLPKALASPVTGQSATLRVVDTEGLFGEATWTYEWSLLKGPAGVTASFAPNKTNGSKKTIMTLSAKTPGDYLFRVTITAPDGSSITSEVDVKVSA